MSSRATAIPAVSLPIPIAVPRSKAWWGSRTLPCTKCGEMARGSRGVLFWIGAVVFFPLSLLAFIDEELCRCQTCGFHFLAERRGGGSPREWVRNQLARSTQVPNNND